LRSKLLRTIGFCVALAGPAAPATVRAQVVGPTVPRRAFEVGYTFDWYHRDMTPHAPAEKKWQSASVYTAYGATDWLSVSLEGGYWPVHYDDFPGTDYQRYVAGAGLSARLVEVGPALVGGTFRFSETIDFDRSAARFHKSTRSVLVWLHADVSRTVRGQTVDAWAGPLFARDVGKNYFFGNLDPLKDASEHDFGAGVGARAVLFDRVVPSVRVIYAGYFEPRVSVGVRL